MSIIPIFIPHAGCPHQCVFCNQRAISGTKNSGTGYAEKQIEEYLQWVSPSPANEAAFYGGTFTALPRSLQEELLALTDKLIEQKIIGAVRMSTRPDYIFEEELEFLKKHNVKLIELGVQSLDNDVLNISERGHSMEDVEKAMHLLKKYEFKTGLQLMTGMPGQDFDSIKDTIEKACAMKPDIARIYPLLVVKNTKLETMYLKGEFTPLTLEEAIEQAAYMYEKLTRNNCLVIRTGLQADEELCSDGNILAGPFHPSMGELVKSRIIRKHVEKALDNFAKDVPDFISSTTADKKDEEKILLKEYRIELPAIKKDVDVPEMLTLQVLNASAKKHLFHEFKPQKASLLTLFPGSKQHHLRLQLICSSSMVSKVRGIKNCNTLFWQNKLNNIFASHHR